MKKVLALSAALGVLTGGVAAAATSGYDGPPRWESTTVTITADLQPAAQQWGDTLDFRVAPPEQAQIRTTASSFADEEVGGEAQVTYRDGNYIEQCLIALPDANTDPAILTHELGHCLGLTHRSGVTSSNMHWWAGDEQGGWSDTVTDADRARLADRYQHQLRSKP